MIARWLNGLQTDQIWDSHVHLVGAGTNNSGIYMNPAMQSWRHPVFHVQTKFYMNAVCVKNEDPNLDKDAFAGLCRRLNELPQGIKAMVLAFDAWHDESGKPDWDATAFSVPNAYARQCAAAVPERIEWIASIHPYREDAIFELEKSAAAGAKAVKWLPPSMGIDPASKRCDAFYDALVRLNIPLLTHAGDEHATPGKLIQEYGNPLKLRRALERGVRVIIAHCASLGAGADLDSKSQSQQPYLTLFARLMNEPQWQKQLLGDLAAVALSNREENVLPTLLQTTQWHDRLLQASDYPLPAVMPVLSLQSLRERSLLQTAEVPVLQMVREHNPLLFDLLLKRALNYRGARFSNAVFHTRPHFQTT